MTQIDPSRGTFPFVSLLLLVCGLAPTVPAQNNLKRSGTANRGLNEVLQPSEAELTKRVTPVVRAVRATADSVFSVLIESPGKRDAVSQGSGVILDEKGLAITNWHVVALATANREVGVRVRLKNGNRYDAKVLSVSREYDLALLQLEIPSGGKVQPVTMGDSDSLMIGETVIAIGNPRGHQNTVTVGVLSAADRAINVRTPDGRIRNYKGLLQTDAAINQGNSGGALLDITGKLIGINNAMATDSENIGFAIPANTVRKVFHEVLLSSENLTAVYLGMQVRAKKDRVLLADVSLDGPAYRAGLRAGDELVRINDKKVESTLDYARSLLGVEAARPITITVRRGTKELTQRTVPMSNAAWTVVRRIGIELRRVSLEQDRKLVEGASRQLFRELREPMRGPLRGVLLVERIRRGSPADNLGLKRGDILLAIVDRVPDFFGTRSILRTFDSVTDLNDSLHVMSRRYRDPEYQVWIYRGGEILDGPMDIPRL